MPDPAYDELLKNPWRFEFGQAMRILLRNSSHGDLTAPADRRFDVTHEPVRIGASQSLAFPASDIQSLTPPESNEEHLKMSINFLGLTGPSGVLPLPYTELLMESIQSGDFTAADFFDVFNHRLAMLFYYAWERYRFPVSYERRTDHNPFHQILLSLVGLGTEHLRGQSEIPDEFFARYAALLAMQPRSASALRTILADYFNVPVEVEQFAGTWYQLDPASTTQFRDEDTESERMGYGVVVSEEYWSQESMVRLRIGPLDLPAYRRFLRGGPDFASLRRICRFFSRDELVFELQLILHKDAVPDARLGADGTQGSQLGWTTWAKSAPFQHHAEDVIVRL